MSEDEAIQIVSEATDLAEVLIRSVPVGSDTRAVQVAALIVTIGAAKGSRMSMVGFIEQAENLWMRTSPMPPFVGKWAALPEGEVREI
jgi:hypothetical protein